MNAQDFKTVKLVINSDQVQQKLDDINKKPSSRPPNTSKLKANLEIHKSSDNFIENYSTSTYEIIRFYCFCPCVT